MQNAQQVDKLLDQIELEFGPRDLLSRFFLKAANAAADRGVFLEFATFEQLIEINNRNLANWRPLTTSFHPDIGGARNDRGYVIIGRNADGEVVATQAAKLLDWSNTNFKLEAESLRYFYANPERDKVEGESCTVTAPNAEEITGRVLHSGAIWYHPEVHGRQLAQIMPRFGRAYACTRWDVDEVCGIISDANSSRDLDKRTGYREITRHVTIRNMPGYPGSETKFVLCRMRAADLVDDLFGFVVDFDSEVDVAARTRRA